MFEEPHTPLPLDRGRRCSSLAVGYRVLGEPPARAAAGRGRGAGRGAAAPSGTRAGRRLYVHVAGAVRRPGLYRVPDGARVAAAPCGSPAARSGKAELTTTNLAARVQDGQQIVVPARGGARSPPRRSRRAAPGAPAPARSAWRARRRPSSRSSTGSARRSRARIIEYRDAHGGFRSVEELGEVDGIGEVRLEALREAVQP